MILTLHLEFTTEEGNVVRTKRIDVNTRNKDLYLIFEAWKNVQRIESPKYYSSFVADELMNKMYDYVLDFAESRFGLTHKMYDRGDFDIDGVHVLDENTAEAAISIYVKK